MIGPPSIFVFCQVRKIIVKMDHQLLGLFRPSVRFLSLLPEEIGIAP